MKTGILFVVLMFLALSCKDPATDPPAMIKYEVLTAEGNWYGEYISETGERICFCAPPLPPSGWTYSFIVKKKPFTLHIDATSDCACITQTYSPDVTANIYVDNKLVATNTSNWAPGLASADYVVK